MRIKIWVLLLAILMVLPAFSQIRAIDSPLLSPSKPKIHATGHAQYYGNAKYISAYLTLKIDGRPLSNVKVWINDSLMMNHGNGNYGGSIPSTYKIRIGNELVFSVEFPKTPYMIGSPPPYTGKIVLGTYRISNIINWVWPKPDEVVSLSKVLNLIFRWDFTGTPAVTQFFLKDKATNTEIFSVHTSAEQQSVSARLFSAGKEYAMGLWAVDPIDKFALTKHCAPGSRIDWYFSSIMTFKIAKGPSPLIIR